MRPALVARRRSTKGGAGVRIRLQFGATSKKRLGGRDGPPLQWLVRYTNMKHSVAKIVCALVVVALSANDSSQVASASERDPPGAAANGANPYAQLTDQQWTEVVESWERLDGADRRWFLTEIRKRKMRVDGRRAGKQQPAIAYRVRARFGYPARQPNAEARDADRRLERPLLDDGNRYGLGFEQRRRERLGGVELRVRLRAKADAAVQRRSPEAARVRDAGARGRRSAPTQPVPASSPRASSNAL